LPIYDLAVIGAGIAGCSIANYANSKDKNVLIIDRASTPATGGSGAAGAFISPKLGHKTPLLELTNIAYKYASNFYSTYYKDYFDKSGIARVPKDSKDEAKLEFYQDIIANILNSNFEINSFDCSGKILSTKELKKLGVNSGFKSLFYADGGVCDAQGLCSALIKDIKFKQLNVETVQHFSDYIEINSEIKAKKVILATGYEGFKDYLNYMGIRYVWGSRGDFYTNSDIKVCMHQNISVSATLNGVVKIGATHVKVKNPCMACDGEPLKELINKAKELACIDNLELKETFCGMRSGSHDYLPLVGRLIDAKYMLKNYPKIKQGFKKAPIKYIDNIFVFNGLGGRGFVFAPLMAKWLYEFMYDEVNLNPYINPDRLFLKWARKLNI